MYTIPPLVQIHLYRSALKDVETATRQTRDKKLHAWVVKELEASRALLLDRAKDEMDESLLNEEERKKRKDAEFYGIPFEDGSII